MGGSPSVQISAVNMNGEVANSIRQQIAQEKVVIYSKTYCPYCTMAKKVFDDMKYPYTCVELDQHPKGREMQDALDLMTGARTVPRVFINGKCIGGGTDTRQLFKEGKLQEMLTS